METEKIHWQLAIEQLKENKIISQNEIDFNNEPIPVKYVGYLNKKGIRVPENLIFYNDDDIDCSDIPEITDEDIDTGKIQWISIEEFPIEPEIRN